MLNAAEEHLSHLSHLPCHAELVNALAVKLGKRGNTRRPQSPADRVNELIARITEGTDENPL